MGCTHLLWKEIAKQVIPAIPIYTKIVEEIEEEECKQEAHEEIIPTLSLKAPSTLAEDEGSAMVEAEEIISTLSLKAPSTLAEDEGSAMVEAEEIIPTLSLKASSTLAEDEGSAMVEEKMEEIIPNPVPIPIPTLAEDEGSALLEKAFEETTPDLIKRISASPNPFKCTRSHQNLHANSPYPCTLCKSAFACGHHLYSHIVLHHSIKATTPLYNTFKCGKCLKCYKVAINLSPPKLVDIISAHVCNVSVVPPSKIDEAKADNALINTEFENGFACKECPKRFASIYYLKKHRLLKHPLTNTNVCHGCGTAFHTYYKLKKHLALPNVPCPTCSRSFTCAGGLKEHHCSGHMNATTTTTCPGCSKDFSTPHYLKKHASLPAGPCPVCACSFSCNYMLSIHVCRPKSNY